MFYPMKWRQAALASALLFLATSVSGVRASEQPVTVTPDSSKPAGRHTGSTYTAAAPPRPRIEHKKSSSTDPYTPPDDRSVGRGTRRLTGEVTVNDQRTQLGQRIDELL